MTSLSPHFSLKELTLSQTAIRKGISNEPTKEHLKNMQLLVINCLDPLFKKYGKIIISSCYRSEDLNKAVGGSKTSQHCEGKAADIVVPEYTIKDVFNYIKGSQIQFDQLIEEFGRWVHISFNGAKNRRQCLIAKTENGKTIYIPA